MQADGIFDKYAETSADTIGPEGDAWVPMYSTHAHHELNELNHALKVRNSCSRSLRLKHHAVPAGIERFCTDLGLDPSDKRVGG